MSLIMQEIIVYVVGIQVGMNKNTGAVLTAVFERL